MINFEAVEHEPTIDSAAIAEVAGGLAVEAFAESPLKSDLIETIVFVSQGLTNHEIGQKKFVTVNTVKDYLKEIYPALGANNRPHAVNIAINKGIIPVEVKSSKTNLPPKVAEVMPLVAAGFNNDEIAARLGRGKETIKTQIRTALEVLGANNRAQAVRRMYETGLWELPEAS